MNPRKGKDVISVLEAKGFIEVKKGNDHKRYYLYINNIRQPVYTYFSLGKKKECDGFLMGRIKNQLKFKDSYKAEDFFNCPMTAEQYIEMLLADPEIKLTLPPPESEEPKL